MRDDRIVKALEGIKDRLYADQPETMTAMVNLIDLLQTVFCDHELKTHRNPDTPDDPGETVLACVKCGYEPEEQ